MAFLADPLRLSDRLYQITGDFMTGSSPYSVNKIGLTLGRKPVDNMSQGLLPFPYKSLPLHPVAVYPNVESSLDQFKMLNRYIPLDLMYNRATKEQNASLRQSPYGLNMSLNQRLSPSTSSTSSSPLSDSSYSQPIVQDTPIDLSKPKASPTTISRSGSKLENLLSDRNTNRKRKSSSVVCDDDNGSPLNLSKKAAPISRLECKNGPGDVIDMKDAVDNPSQLIQLADVCLESTAKQVSELLVQMVQKVFSVPSFSHLSENDKIALLHNSWHRLMLWLFASNHLSFQVSPTSDVEEMSDFKAKGHRFVNHPSMAFVKSISSFLQRYNSLNIDQEELSLLFAITLFHCGKDVCNTNVVEKQRKELMKHLQSYTMQRKNGIKRYTELLLYLPLLYGVNEKMFEKLFCSQLLKVSDVKLWLKEAVKRIGGQNHVATPLQ